MQRTKLYSRVASCKASSGRRRESAMMCPDSNQVKSVRFRHCNFYSYVLPTLPDSSHNIHISSVALTVMLHNRQRTEMSYMQHLCYVYTHVLLA